MPIFEIETDQGVFEIDADREPTQAEALQAIAGQSPVSQPSRQLKPSTQATLEEQERLRQEIIQREQRPGLAKAIEAALGAGKAVASPFIAGVKGLGSIPELVAEPSRIPATVLEAGRRAGIDIVQLGEMLRPKTPVQAAFGPLGAPGAAIIEGIANLRPRTPTEQEIQAELEARPLQEEIERARATVPSAATPLALGLEAAFERAQPEAAEAVTQLAEVISPIKGAQALKAGGKGIASIPRRLRSAIKPSKAQVGAKIEKASADEMAEIFHRNPNADKIADSPIEGFGLEVNAALKETGERLSALKAQSGSVLNAGNELADKMLDKAVALEKAGQPRAVVEELTNRAEDVRGRLTDINSLQDAVTIANRKPNVLKPKTTAEGFADEIISQEGGALINRELQSISGPEGAAIRKKWSNLKLLNDNVQDRINKIINSAPPDAPPAIVNALTSLEGGAGIFALLNGYASGLVPVASAAVKSWAKREAKALRDSNVIIERAYNDLRKNPPVIEAPPVPAATP